MAGPASSTVATCACTPLEIRRERLDRGVRHARMDGADAGGVVSGTEVRQVVAVHRRQHDIPEPHQGHRVGDVGRLHRIEPTARVAGVDRAELAGAGAHRTHQHQRGGAALPALGDIGTLGFGTNGGEPVRLDDVQDFLVPGTAGQPHAQPRRLALGIGNGAVGVGLDAVQHRRGSLRTEDLAARYRALRVGGFAHGLDAGRPHRARGPAIVSARTELCCEAASTAGSRTKKERPVAPEPPRSLTPGSILGRGHRDELALAAPHQQHHRLAGLCVLRGLVELTLPTLTLPTIRITSPARRRRAAAPETLVTITPSRPCPDRTARAARR